MKLLTHAGLPAACLLLSSVLLGPVFAASSLPNFADLVEINALAIVEITTVRQVSARSRFPGGDLDDLLRRFNPDDEQDLEDIPEMRERGAVGSGFITSDNGYVITNHHVVNGADQIEVHLNDRRVFQAEVVGMDEPSDLALLKIEASGLPHVEFGDSDKLRVGDWVLAIGSPFGLEFSAAAGIVSAKGRSVPGPSASSYNYMSVIQTDVAINQGNSGGPLFNLAGEVVGINSQILSSTGGSNGISFSIPSNVAMNVVNQLRETGQVKRGLLGVRIKEVDFALAETFGMDRPRGAFVDEVQPRSPAAAAGIENDDIVIEFNNHAIETSGDLPFFVGQYRPDTTADLLVFRSGGIETLQVTLGSSPTNETIVPVANVIEDRRNPLGFRVSELSNEAKQVSGLNGVRISELSAGPGRQAGLAEGDVIVSLNRQEISSTDQFATVTNQLPDSGFVPIRIVRGGQATTLALELNR